MNTFRIHRGDAIRILRNLPDCSVDAVITDPPYAEVSRAYGRLSESQWMQLIQSVVIESRRVLKPRGSAVFVLQPNSRCVGSMRSWLWDFMAWASREWNIVQDAWWWNISTPPSAQAMRRHGLMRGSLKACVWLGDRNCNRYQDDALWTESLASKARYAHARFERKVSASGMSINAARIAEVSAERGGVTPFNVLPIPGGCRDADGHPAVTPPYLANWWTRYISRPGQTVLDPFCGSGTIGVEALLLGRNYVGIERSSAYIRTARRRLATARQSMSRSRQSTARSGFKPPGEACR